MIRACIFCTSIAADRHQGRARDLGFGYSTFFKDEMFLTAAARCATLSQRRRLLRSHRPEVERMRPQGKGEVELGWIGAGWGLLLGEVSHLSTRGNMRSGSLYCDVRSSPRDTLNHLAPHPIQILAILEPDLRPSTFKFMGHIYLVCQGSNNKISGTREVPWRHKNTKRNNI